MPGQLKTDELSNEIPAIPKLLDLPGLKGSTVPIDQVGTQKAIAFKITEKEANYILALKGNQSTLNDDVRLFFEDKELTARLESHEETDGGQVALK